MNAFFEKLTHRTTFEIDISKSFCYCCKKWFKCFKNQAGALDPKFLLHSYYEKLYDRWALPGHVKADAIFKEIIDKHLQGALHRTIRSRRSESPENRATLHTE